MLSHFRGISVPIRLLTPLQTTWNHQYDCLRPCDSDGAEEESYTVEVTTPTAPYPKYDAIGDQPQAE